MDERCRDRLTLGRASFASKSGMAKLLTCVKKEGLPETFDRSAQYRARKHVCQTETPYGKLVDTTPVAFRDGTDGRIAFRNPLAFLHYHCDKSSQYAEIVRKALERKPCSTASLWQLIIYQDGVDPSDGLAKNHSRKSDVSYWTFIELGMHALADEEVWGTVCVTRATQANKLEGKVGQLAEKVLEHFLDQSMMFNYLVYL